MTIQELVHIEINGNLDLYEKVKLEITETELTLEKLLNV